MKVPCHIVPLMVIQHGLLLERGYSFKFQKHTYDSPEGRREACGRCIYPESKHREKCGLIQPTNTENDYHLRYVGKDTLSFTSHLCMLRVMLVGADNTPAMTGSYFVQMLES